MTRDQYGHTITARHDRGDIVVTSLDVDTPVSIRLTREQWQAILAPPGDLVGPADLCPGDVVVRSPLAVREVVVESVECHGQWVVGWTLPDRSDGGIWFCSDDDTFDVVRHASEAAA